MKIMKFDLLYALMALLKGACGCSFYYNTTYTTKTIMTLTHNHKEKRLVGQACKAFGIETQSMGWDAFLEIASSREH